MLTRTGSTNESRWWEVWLSRLDQTDTSLSLVEARNVKTVFGNKVSHYAHKADVLRLEAMKFYGGIYLDSDVLVLRGPYLTFLLVRRAKALTRKGLDGSRI